MIINIISSTYQINTALRQKKKTGISFGARNLGDEVIYNTSEEIDNKIKQILEEAIAKKRPLVHEDISKEMNLNVETTHNRILNNTELRVLWNDVIHRPPIKRRTSAIVHTKNKPEVNELILNIKSLLEKAVETKEPIAAIDIANQLGITKDMIFNRIHGNPELLYLWNNCNRRTRTNQSILKQNSIKNVLIQCQENKAAINFHELSLRTGLSEQTCKTKIMRDKELLYIWNMLKDIKAEQKSDTNKKIKDILIFYIKRGMILEIDKIAKQADLDVRVCKHKIYETPELFKLWQTGIHKRSKLPTRKESEAINTKIKEILQEANRRGIPLRSEDIAKKAGCNNQISYGRLKRIKELRALWEENMQLSADKFQSVNTKIKEEIEKAVAENRVLSFDELSKLTGVSKSNCSHRIYTNKDLRSLWNKIQIIAEKTIIQKIEKAILDAKENNDKITYALLEKNYGITPDVLKARLKENKKLKELWDSAEHMVGNLQKAANQQKINKFEQSIINDKKIEAILQKAIDEGKSVFQKEIAEEVGMTQGACKERIRRIPKLQTLWQQIEHKKCSDSSQELYNKLYSILQNTLAKNEEISIEELAKQAGITKMSCFGRLRNNDDLNNIWLELQENRQNLLKQIAKLKLQKISDTQIQKELGLNDKVFGELLNKFENIRRLILSHSDKEISISEYLKWATLTKREFELAVTKLFEKMGYKSGVTQYSIDGGIDVIAFKNGKKTYIECVHNLEQPLQPNEVLALQGCKYYFGADNTILIASSGVCKDAKNVATAINKNSDGNYRIMTLEDIIKEAKKHNLDINSLKGIQNINHKQTQEIERKRWFFKKLETVTDEERNEWKNYSKHDFLHCVKQIFEKQGYKISLIGHNILKNGYLLEKNNETSILQYIPNSDRQIDAIRGLYGIKDLYKAKNVIAFGLDTLTFATQDFINMVNKKYGKECAFKVLSLDKIINASKKLL